MRVATFGVAVAVGPAPTFHATAASAAAAVTFGAEAV